MHTGEYNLYPSGTYNPTCASSMKINLLGLQVRRFMATQVALEVWFIEKFMDTVMR